MLVKDFMRDVMLMVGDSAGALVSKDFVVQSMNEEMRYVLSKFPSMQRLTHTPAAETNAIELDTLFGESPRMSIKRVLVNGCPRTCVSAREIERLVEL